MIPWGEVKSLVRSPRGPKAFLRDKYANQRIDVINRGVGGEEAPKELDRMNRDVIAEKPSVLVLLPAIHRGQKGSENLPHQITSQ
jgi:hypothetical protein